MIYTIRENALKIVGLKLDTFKFVGQKKPKGSGNKRKRKALAPEHSDRNLRPAPAPVPIPTLSQPTLSQPNKRRKVDEENKEKENMGARKGMVVDPLVTSKPGKPGKGSGETNKVRTLSNKILVSLRIFIIWYIICVYIIQHVARFCEWASYVAERYFLFS